MSEKIERRVRLYRSRERAETAWVQAAEAGGGILLGERFTDPATFFGELWEVWGDGRPLVSNAQRELLMQQTLADQRILSATPGAVRLFARFAEMTAGSFDADILREDKALSGCVRDAVIELMSRYFQTLRKKGLVEPDEAATLLRDAAAPVNVEVAEYLELLPAERRLLEYWGTDTAVLDVDARVSAPAQGVEPAFLFPSGQAAAPIALYEELTAWCIAGQHEGMARRALVLSPEPKQTFDSVAPWITADGGACGLRCSVPFARTWLGRACDAVAQVLAESPRWVDAATDFAYNPWSGITHWQAEALNGALRGDRLQKPADAEARLCVSEAFPVIRDVVGADESRATRAAARLADLIPSRLSAEDRLLERAAVQSLASFLDARLALGGSAGNVPFKDAVADLTVAFAAMTEVPEQAGAQASDKDASRSFVLFEPMGRASGLAPSSWDLVVLTDISGEALNARMNRSSLDALAARLGVTLSTSRLNERRILFSSAMEAARSRFTCMLSLRDVAGEEAYPAFLFSEYADALAESENATGACERDEDRFNLPVDAQTRETGEGELLRAVGARLAAEKPAGNPASEATRRYSVPTRGRLESVRLADYYETVPGSKPSEELPVLSPSALERYMTCPYLWFANSCLGLREVDEVFGPRSSGTFAHSAFSEYYARAAESAEKGADAAHLEPGGLFDQVFDELLAAQSQPGRKRHAVATKLEALEMERLREDVRGSLRRQLRLPAGFKPFGHEIAISREDAVDYAGARLVGRADRVDVGSLPGETGQAYVVIDYKGGVGGYNAGFSEKDDAGDYGIPDKIQALVYARALRRKFGSMQCGGALYLGYRAKNDKSMMAGSYNGVRYDVTSFTGKGSLVEMDFEEFLDLVENNLRPVVSSLMAGEIKPEPGKGEACEDCPWGPSCGKGAR